MDNKAIISLVVFILVYFLIGIEKTPRMYVVIAGVIFLILSNVYSFEEIHSYIDWSTIGFLFGIFIVLKILENSGFFNYLSLKIAKKFNYNPLKIFIVFPFLAWFLSEFVGSITVLVFMSPLTYALSRILKFDPIPFVIAEVCLANIGGAGTLMGDPPNVILGSMFRLGFINFIINNWILSFLGGIGAIFVFFKMNKKNLIDIKSNIKKEKFEELIPEEAIEDRLLMKLGLTGISVTVFLLILRDFLMKHLSFNIALCSSIPAFAILFLKGGNPKLKNILKEIDIETLIFFIGLFAIVGSLEKTKVIQSVALSFGKFSQKGIQTISLLFWGSAFTSSVIDNVPEAMSIGYLVKHLLSQIPYSFTILIWSSSLGLDIGGNLTPVGASANVVGYTFLEKQGVKIGWKKWIKLATFPTMVSLFICWAGLLLKWKLGFY